MADDYIVVARRDRTQLGNQYIRAANDLLELCDRVEALNNAGQHMFDVADYTVFETQFGISTGEGANALSLLGLINTILNTNTDVTGVNRLNQLREFIARVAGQ